MSDTKIRDVTLTGIKAGPDDGLGDGQFAAYASVFGNVDSYGDVVVKGAFTDTLAEWDASGDPIPLLWGHNFFDPDYNLGSVLTAAEDDHGLLVTGQLDLESPKAAQVYRLIKGRRVRQMSFAYDVLDGSSVTKDEQTVYELRKLRLHEVSIVPLGANQETEILAVKHAAASAANLAAEVKAGRVLSAKNESEIRAAHESLGRVLDALGDSSEDQGKASGHTPAKVGASDETPEGKSSAPAAAGLNPSASELADLQVLELELETT